MRWNLNLKLVLIILSLLVAACGKSNSSRPAASTPNSGNHNGPAAAYQGSQFDPHSALNGMGQWVTIGDQSYFVPNNSQIADTDGEDWAPYQRGYWSYDQEQSWTWVSYEPWGWVTDHYGIWRHHQTHGWIWLPFHDRRYVPHTVTWFDEGDYVGWYPYYSDYAQGYRHGQSYGFNDGYWDGFKTVLRINTPGFSFRMGLTLVNRRHVTHANIRRVVVRDRSLVFSLAYRAHQEDRIRLGRVGRYPGGHRERSYDFLQRFASERAPIGRSERVRSRGGAVIVQPHRSREIPPEYRRRGDWRDQRSREVPDNGRPPVVRETPRDVPREPRREWRQEQRPRPEQRPVEQRPVEQRPAAPRPTEQRPSEQRQPDRREFRPQVIVPERQRPAPTATPAEERPVTSRPDRESRGAEPRAAQPRATENRGSEVSRDEARPQQERRSRDGDDTRRRDRSESERR